MKQSIFISAGELSGNQHASDVVRQIQSISGNSFSFFGMGGPLLRERGVEAIIDSDESGNLMGFIPVLLSLRKIASMLAQIKAALVARRPSLVILVDYPDFHFRVARYAKQLGIPVLFYISPSVWAWRSGRVKLVNDLVDCMAVIYPFEREYYERRGCSKAIYVGHPFADEIPTEQLDDKARAQARSKYQLDPHRRTLALLPGSREREIRRNLTPCLEAFRIVSRSSPDLVGAIPIAPSLSPRLFSIPLPPNVRLTEMPARELMRCSDVGLLKSGTSNLEAAFCGLPFSMFYIADPLSEVIVRTIVKLKEYSIVNIIRSGTIREFTQRQASPASLATETLRLLEDTQYRAGVSRGLREVVSLLRSHDQDERFLETASPSERVARLALSLLKPSKLAPPAL